ncbi:uncharacterized protein HMPREF1541_08785 [Cyphellophora europaea CBS 101466]|uniref:Long chronological lifespan protein 2 n=1 Tax=Cyphellophora europaea (strain CBS 101466) TaxID=1220924 RepID=W2RJ42_CYPE1|nr:uncharacterized protein HMPREF1541_08785 [Cyphellophora europaea CBS 101466]ETN36507.1 hypothetical protein HMPREF1541_08785 [Cyphellophora europaea CBS 101466]
MFNRMLVGLILLFAGAVHAQFQFFDNFFSGHQGGQQAQQQGNSPSDSNWYQQNWDQAKCSNYLCPDTLACVHFPHHCPCPHAAVEEKVELGDGVKVCASKGGFKQGETNRKIDLARKGLL